MVNDLMVRNTTQGRFVTFFWMILDAPAGTLTYVNAGHNPPLICREDGTIDRLEEGGLVLGVMKPPMPYQEAGAVLRKGDALLLYTDGVSEAMSPAAEEYGDARLEKELIRLRSRQASDICREVVASVTAFAAGAGQADDITLVVLKKASE
jgi:sigma-B regulation protein RsbU (phosphoserine phosphatase)